MEKEGIPLMGIYKCRAAKNARSVNSREMKHRVATELYSFP
jgi:hypothetical protein